jgi:hypothetical protein
MRSAHQRRALGEPPRHREDQRHGHVGGVLGQHAWRVGHGDAARDRGLDVDVVDAVAEVGDQLEVRASLLEGGGVNSIGHRWNQDIGGLQRRGDLGLAHRLIVDVQPRFEQLAHAGFDAVRQLPRDDHQGFLGFRHL